MERLAGDTYYIPGLANAGFRGGCMIDTPPDETDFEGLDVREVLVTHGHADHFSTAPQLSRRGARIIAHPKEVAFIEDPEVTMRGMFSGARPSDDMVTRLFRGEGCRVDGFLDRWHDSGIDLVPLPGHTPGHSGFLTSDGVLFTGDALYQRAPWEKHPLPYASDIGGVRASLEHIAGLEYDWLVPGHGAPASRPDSELDVAHHIAEIDSLCDYIVETLREPATTEGSIALVSGHVGLNDSPTQYWLAVATVKAFLSHLVEEGLLEFEVREHAGYWHTVD